jgi:hypothetical protein
MALGDMDGGLPNMRGRLRSDAVTPPRRLRPVCLPVLPDFLAASYRRHRAGKAWLNIRQPDMIGPAVGADLDVVAAIDQHPADAGRVHFAERDVLRVGRHGRPSKGLS